MSNVISVEQIRADFAKVFGVEADHTFFSPGRINLIGEHTDYNGGHVFPAAISLGTYGAARKRDDQLLRFFSGNKGLLKCRWKTCTLSLSITGPTIQKEFCIFCRRQAIRLTEAWMSMFMEIFPTARACLLLHR